MFASRFERLLPAQKLMPGEGILPLVDRLRHNLVEFHWVHCYSLRSDPIEILKYPKETWCFEFRDVVVCSFTLLMFGRHELLSTPECS